jgi:antitoxin component YwqK of YwqJK toxin-antitoxin module
VLNGKYTSWYDNGQIMGEGNYKDGKIVGKYTFWHRNGQIDSEKTVN